MESSKLIVQIPDPCQADWNKMRPEVNGRFCSSCSKTVIDFTGKTDVEIKDILTANSNSKVCGHFKSSQLDRPLQITVDLNNLPGNMSVTRKFAIVLLLVFGSMLVSCYDHKGKKINTIQVTTGEPVYTTGFIIEPLPKTSDTLIETFDEPELLGEVAASEGVLDEIDSVTPETRLKPDLIDSMYIIKNYPVDTAVSEDSEVTGKVMQHDPESIKERETTISGGVAWNPPQAQEPEKNVRGMVSMGTYYVEGKKVTTCVSPGVEKNMNFKVSPNPGDGWFTISYDLKQRADTRLNVFDIEGRLVQTIAVTNQQYEGQYQIPVDLSLQPNGIYIVSFICDGVLITKKLVKE